MSVTPSPKGYVAQAVWGLPRCSLGEDGSVANKIKKSMSLKISLAILLLLGSTACKQVHQSPHQSKTGNMLQVELRMTKPWKHIVIGPTQQKEYPKIPNHFSMFMTGESTGTLEPYLNVSSEISQHKQQSCKEYTQ